MSVPCMLRTSPWDVPPASRRAHGALGSLSWRCGLVPAMLKVHTHTANTWETCNMVLQLSAWWMDVMFYFLLYQILIMYMIILSIMVTFGSFVFYALETEQRVFLSPPLPFSKFCFNCFSGFCLRFPIPNGSVYWSCTLIRSAEISCDILKRFAPPLMGLVSREFYRGQGKGELEFKLLHMFIQAVLQ